MFGGLGGRWGAGMFGGGRQVEANSPFKARIFFTFPSVRQVPSSMRQLPRLLWLVPGSLRQGLKRLRLVPSHVRRVRMSRRRVPNVLRRVFYPSTAGSQPDAAGRRLDAAPFPASAAGPEPSPAAARGFRPAAANCRAGAPLAIPADGNRRRCPTTRSHSFFSPMPLRETLSRTPKKMQPARFASA